MENFRNIQFFQFSLEKFSKLGTPKLYHLCSIPLYPNSLIPQFPNFSTLNYFYEKKRTLTIIHIT